MHHPEDNPWKIVSQKEVYSNPWIALTEYQVINPSGNPGIYGKVHYKNIAIGVIPLDNEMNTYLVGQYRFAPGQYSWEIPEGGGIIGTDPLESAKRELLEETGLKAENWTEIQRLHLSNSVSDELCIIYLARNLQQFEPEPEDTEETGLLGGQPKRWGIAQLARDNRSIQRRDLVEAHNRRDLEAGVGRGDDWRHIWPCSRHRGYKADYQVRPSVVVT